MITTEIEGSKKYLVVSLTSSIDKFVRMAIVRIRNSLLRCHSRWVRLFVKVYCQGSLVAETNREDEYLFDDTLGAWGTRLIEFEASYFFSKCIYGYFQTLRKRWERHEDSICVVIDFTLNYSILRPIVDIRSKKVPVEAAPTSDCDEEAISETDEIKETSRLLSCGSDQLDMTRDDSCTVM